MNGSSGVPSVVRANGGDDDSKDNDSLRSLSRSNLEIVSLGKSIKKHGQSLVDVAKIESKQKEKMAKLQAEEKEKERNHQDQVEMRNTI